MSTSVAGLPHPARLALPALDRPLAFDEPMAQRCSFGVGGPADAYCEAPTPEDEERLLRWARRFRLPVTRWTGDDQRIVADGGLRGLVLGPGTPEGRAPRRLFREPVRGSSVDVLVSRVGLRGLRVRGARISPEDGNRVENVGDATARDVLLLMDSIRRRVARDQGLQLVAELEVIGRRRAVRGEVP